MKEEHTSHRPRILGAFVTVLLTVVALIWCYKIGLHPTRLRLAAADSSIKPLLITVTRGRLETSYEQSGGVEVERAYYNHRFYSLNGRLKPVPKLRYWAESCFQRLGFQGKAVSTTHPILKQTSTDTSVLWLLHLSSNSVVTEDAVLVSDNGLRLPLSSPMGVTLGSGPEQLDCWELPSLLTNRGKYELFLPSLNQTLLTFRYE
jgi:hypothetical protein